MNEATFRALLNAMRGAERVIEEMHRRKRIEEIKANPARHLSFVLDKNSNDIIIVFQNRVEIGTLRSPDSSSWLDSLNDPWDFDFFIGWSEVWELPILYLGKHTELRIEWNEHFEGDLPQLLEDWLSIGKEK